MDLHSPRSRYKGVNWCKTHKKWRVRVTYNNVGFWVDRFDDERQAALAFDYAQERLRGPWAKVNHPTEQATLETRVKVARVLKKRKLI